MNGPVTSTSTPANVAPNLPRAAWLAVLAVPGWCLVVGALALPRPTGADEARATIDRGALGDVVRKTAPPSRETLDETFVGDKLKIVGADFPVAPVAPGASFRLSTVFSVLGELDRSWKMFLHIDLQRGRFRIHGDHFPAEGAYPTTSWQSGEFVTDRFDVKVPLDAPPGEYDIFIGLYIGDERMPLTKGANHDSENRVRLGRIRVQ